MKKIVAKPYLLLILVLSIISNSGFAADTLLSKQAIIEKAQSHVQGRVLAADLQRSKPPRYKVKILRADGRLKVLHMNAKTGSLIRARKK